jgi:hypothetical protein
MRSRTIDIVCKIANGLYYYPYVFILINMEGAVASRAGLGVNP